MEYNLDLHSDCRGREQRDLLLQFLREESRPLLEDEVSPAHRDLYRIVEELEYPECTSEAGERVFRASWMLGGDKDEGLAIIQSLLRAGIHRINAGITPDGMIDEAQFYEAADESIREVNVDIESIEKRISGLEESEDWTDELIDKVLFQVLEELSMSSDE